MLGQGVRWMIVVLCAAVLTSGYCAAAEENADAYPDPKRWSREAETFAQWDRKNTFPENAVLFVGSSSIVYWPTAEAFGEYPVINRGFGGSVMADSVYYAEPFILKYQPKVVVVYAGDNDCAAGIEPALVGRDFQRLADTIHAALPDTQIICLSVKLSDSRKSLWDAMRKVNGLFAQYADIKAYITYLDVNAPLLDDRGEPVPELYLPDRLHLSEKGYLVWNRVLGPILKDRYAAAMKAKAKNP